MRLSRVWITTAALAFGVAPAAFAQQDKGESEQQSETIPLSSLPDPVRQSIEKLAEGGHVDKVQERTEGGKKRYEAWIKKGEEKFGAVLDDSGKVLRYDRHKPGEHKKGDHK